MPSISRAKLSAQKIFSIILEPSKIDPLQSIEKENDKFLITEGKIVLKNVEFKYPSRSKMILCGLNLEIRPNESIALVGPSGSGKSTIASLLLRFYQKQKG